MTYKPNEDVTLRLGTDLNITGTDIYAFGSGGPPKEGEPDNNGPATDEAIETEFQSTDAAIGLFTDLDYAIGNLRLIPGYDMTIWDKQRNIFYRDSQLGTSLPNKAYSKVPLVTIFNRLKAMNSPLATVQSLRRRQAVTMPLAGNSS